MTVSEDWPVVVTHGCADACVEAFELDDRERARQWLESLITQRGVVTDQLPTWLAGRRSPSGYFLVIDDLFARLNVLPHAVERFQQRCGGHLDPTRARHELLERVAPTPTQKVTSNRFFGPVVHERQPALSIVLKLC